MAPFSSSVMSRCDSTLRHLAYGENSTLRLVTVASAQLAAAVVVIVVNKGDCDCAELLSPPSHPKDVVAATGLFFGADVQDGGKIDRLVTAVVDDADVGDDCETYVMLLLMPAILTFHVLHSAV